MPNAKVFSATGYEERYKLCNYFLEVLFLDPPMLCVSALEVFKKMHIKIIYRYL